MKLMEYIFFNIFNEYIKGFDKIKYLLLKFKIKSIFPSKMFDSHLMQQAELFV